MYALDQDRMRVSSLPAEQCRVYIVIAQALLGTVLSFTSARTLKNVSSVRMWFKPSFQPTHMWAGIDLYSSMPYPDLNPGSHTSANMHLLFISFSSASSPEVDLSQYGVFNRTISSLHGSLRWRHKSHSQMVSITEAALKKVYMKVSEIAEEVEGLIICFVCRIECRKWFENT